MLRICKFKNYIYIIFELCFSWLSIIMVQCAAEISTLKKKRSLNKWMFMTQCFSRILRKMSM